MGWHDANTITGSAASSFVSITSWLFGWFWLVSAGKQIKNKKQKIHISIIIISGGALAMLWVIIVAKLTIVYPGYIRIGRSNCPAGYSSILAIQSSHILGRRLHNWSRCCGNLNTIDYN